MAVRKQTKKYYFSVEGETEQWYLKWLQDKINEKEEAVCKVSFDCPVQKNPLKRAKSLVVRSRTEIWHISDYESDEPVHVIDFTKTLDNMKKVQSQVKQINYKLGYSNFTFDLWIILHMIECNGGFSNRQNYLAPLNRAYDEQFERMADYKNETNFKRCLGKLQLSNVFDAVNRAKTIMQNNCKNGYTLHQYKGYKYYKENPSLTVWEIIEKILKDCKLI